MTALLVVSCGAMQGRGEGRRGVRVNAGFEGREWVSLVFVRRGRGGTGVTVVV